MNNIDDLNEEEYVTIRIEECKGELGALGALTKLSKELWLEGCSIQAIELVEAAARAANNVHR